MSKIISSALDMIRQVVEKDYGGNVSKAAVDLGVNIPTLHNWLNGNRQPSFSKLAPLLEHIGAQIAFPSSDAAKDVCFVDARVMDGAENATPPKAVDYIAAPLVGEVGAGPGFLPENEIKSWFLVYKQLPAVRYRKNLIAVELGPTSNSMQPTLNPKDIVLVDRDDRDVSVPGHIMLVLDPLDGSGMIKRVSIQEKQDDFIITYYSDNAAKWPPMMYSLQRDFNGDWDKSIVGRVIWAWQDMKDK